MRHAPLSLIVRRQIQKEINRELNRISKLSTSKNVTQYHGEFLPSGPGLDDKLETLIIPALSILLNQRIITGGLPTKLNPDTPSLKVYIHSMLVAFTEDNVFQVYGTEVTLSTYTEDRWVYIYIDSDGNFVVNKYSPVIGDNNSRIPICRVWVEHDATDYDISLIRDLRPVGIASANLNHVLRQVFVNLMKSIPSILTSNLDISSHTISGDSNLYVYAQADSDNALFANLTPLPEEAIQIPQPDTGSENYIVLAQATIDNSSPDDLKFEYIVKQADANLENYEIPIALIRDVTSIQTEIQDSQIEIFGVQTKKPDKYSYELTFTHKPTTYNLQWNFKLGENLIAGDPVYVYDSSGTPKIKKTYKQTSSLSSFAKGYYNDSCLIDTNKIAIAYADSNNSNYGTVIIGEIQPDLSINWGTPSVFNSSGTYYLGIVSIDTNKFVVTYRDTGNSSYGTAIIGSVSGSTISWGSETIFNNGNTYYTTCSKLNTDKFVVCYRDYDNNGYGTCCIATVSGTVISFGSEYVFDNNGQTYYHTSTSLGTNKFVVAYRETTGYAIVATVSGTVPTFGTRSQFLASSCTSLSIVDIDTDKWIIGFRDLGDSSNGNLIIGTCTGTTIGSWGTKATFQNSITYYLNIDKLNTNQFVINYGNTSVPYECRYRHGSVAGTTISLENVIKYYDDRLYYPSVTCLDTENFTLIWYALNDAISYAVTYNVNGINTLGQCLGILDETGSLGEIKSVIMLGSITEKLSGMVAGQVQYLQDNGTINNVSSDYPIGIALGSNTMLIYKGAEEYLGL